MQKRIKSIPKHAMEALMNAAWPGNIRELENLIERCDLTQGDELKVPCAELEESVRPLRCFSRPSFEHAERQAIIDALKAASGRIAGKVELQSASA